MSSFLPGFVLELGARLGRAFSNEGKARDSAANWLELADRVWHYRRDRMTDTEAAELNRCRDELRQRVRDRADAGSLKLGIEALEGALRRVGGAIYPKSALTENVEFFVVAVIVILGIRAYFVQPFEIPTNSMWPTYYGLTAENFPPGKPAPGPLERAWRLATLMAWPYEADAPRDGEVSALFFDNGQLAYSLRNGRSWLVFPARFREYTFLVDGEARTIRVPEDFSGVDNLLIETYFGTREAFAAYWQKAAAAGAMEETQFKRDDDSGLFARAVRVPLNRTVKQGDALLRFDILTGDKLIVDRFSYNFVRPHPGSAMVFRTLGNPAIGNAVGHPGLDAFYVKRLVGLPGDVIDIREPVLYRNGRPIEGSAAFDLNARRLGLYRGYFNGVPEYGAHYLLPGESLTVPPHVFFGLGDNSRDSSDGRYWGFVPEKDLVGRPLFIYYPFTRRWGPAK